MDEFLDEIMPGLSKVAERMRPYLGRLQFLEDAEQDASEKVVAFQGLSDTVVREEWKRLGKAQRLRSRMLERFWL